MERSINPLNMWGKTLRYRSLKCLLRETEVEWENGRVYEQKSGGKSQSLPCLPICLYTEEKNLYQENEEGVWREENNFIKENSDLGSQKVWLAAELSSSILRGEPVWGGTGRRRKEAGSSTFSSTLPHFLSLPPLKVQQLFSPQSSQQCIRVIHFLLKTCKFFFFYDFRKTI